MVPSREGTNDEPFRPVLPWSRCTTSSKKVPAHLVPLLSAQLQALLPAPVGSAGGSNGPWGISECAGFPRTSGLIHSVMPKRPFLPRTRRSELNNQLSAPHVDLLRRLHWSAIAEALSFEHARIWGFQKQNTGAIRPFFLSLPCAR